MNKQESMVSFIKETDNDIGIEIRNNQKKIFFSYTLIAVLLELVLLVIARINNNESSIWIGVVLLLIIILEIILFCFALSKSKDPYKGLLYFFGLYAIIGEEVIGYLVLGIVTVASFDVRKYALIVIGCIVLAVLFNICRIIINIKRQRYVNNNRKTKTKADEKYYSFLGSASIAITGGALFIEKQVGVIVFSILIVILACMLATYTVENGMRYYFAKKYNLGEYIS